MKSEALRVWKRRVYKKGPGLSNYPLSYPIRPHGADKPGMSRFSGSKVGVPSESHQESLKVTYH